MTPAAQLGWGLGIGAALGIFYDFLRPLHRRHHAPADLLFVLVMLVAWVYYSFGLCAGQIRVATTGAFLLGLWLWELTASHLLRPVFSGFWQSIFGLFRILTLPLQKSGARTTGFPSRSSDKDMVFLLLLIIFMALF